MAESGFPLPPEAICPLCVDSQRDPVTIPCGDTFCLECIKIYWDQFDHMGVYSCPQCRATFTPRPVLRRDIPDVFHEHRRQLPELTPFPDMHRESFCDFCVGRRNKAVKSCLVCLAYYCETHVKPHYESSTFKRHKLVDETGHLDRKICPQHEKGLELFCRSDQMCICVLCTVREHRSHNIASAEEERVEKQKVLVVTQSEVQYIIQERMKELQELKHNVDVLKSGAQRAQAESDKTFHEMLQAVERWKAEIHQMIMANMQAAMSQADGYVERLEQEILELQRRDAELRQILETEDNIHFLQNFPTLCVAPQAMVPKVLINPQFSFSEMSKTAAEMKEHLDDICKKELGKISKTVSETPVYILLPRNGDKRLKVPSRVDFQEPKTRADFLRLSGQRRRKG
nr:tripartite motif-containing protein 29-like isoform X2 [Nerophis lumbriciformis]